MTNQESFDNVIMWSMSIELHANKGVAVILVGNKCDLEAERKISENEARQMAQSQGMSYYDASAKSDQNVVTFMEDLMSKVYINKKGDTQRGTSFRLQSLYHSSDASTRGTGTGNGNTRGRCCN